MFLHLSVILFTGRGMSVQGVCIPACNGGEHCQADTTPRADTPLGRHPTPPWADTPPPETAIEAGGTHPSGMHYFGIFSQMPFEVNLKRIEDNINFVTKEIHELTRTNSNWLHRTNLTKTHKQLTANSE